MISLKAMPFDSEVAINPTTGAEEYDRVANAEDLAELIRAYFSNGILVRGTDLLTNELQVLYLSAMNCVVKPGMIIINGRTGTLPTQQTITFDVGESNPRIDRVVAELNIAERDIYIKILKGTAAASPSAPAVTQTEDIYQIPLAQVRINANQSVIYSVTDERASYISNVLLNQKASEAIAAATVSISETSRALLGLSVDNANVDKAIQALKNSDMIDLSSYQAFCANVNSNSLDGAFGKNNEDRIKNIGLQLAMCAWCKGANKTTYPFTNLIKANTLAECLTGAAFTECLSNSDILNVLFGSTYVSSMLLSNSTYLSIIAGSPRALNSAIKSAPAKAIMIANAALFNTYHTAMVTSLADTTYFAKTSYTNTTVSTSTFTVGTLTSFADVKSLADTNSTNNYNWAYARHGYDGTEIVHSAFPTGTGTGTITPNVLAVGGFTGLATANSGQTYTLDKYEAI